MANKLALIMVYNDIQNEEKMTWLILLMIKFSLLVMSLIVANNV